MLKEAIPAVMAHEVASLAADLCNRGESGGLLGRFSTVGKLTTTL
jgi:hypothetical protein